MEKVFSLPFKTKEKDSLEITLVNKAKKGDPESFTELYNIYKVYLYKIAYSYVKDENKALDILQECAYRGFLNIAKIKKPIFFKTWITRILINVAIDYLKKDSKIIYLNNDIPMASSKEKISIEEKIDLYNAIDTLREKYKTVIILKYFNNMSIQDISYIMGIPINTVKSHLRRAKEELNNTLKEGYLDEF